MADGPAVLGLRFITKGETIELIIWFAHHDAPASVALPSSVIVESFTLDELEEWYGDVINFLARNQLPSDRYKACEV